jgi:pyridoxine kinase
LNVLSIQSHVAYGHVGNAAAVFPMQRLGVEVWPIHTVQFSNHTGYGSWRGRVFDGPMIEDVVEGVAERGVFARCDAVLSGYIGSAELGGAILAAQARVKAANRQALYACDPVIGDVDKGSFVRPGVAEFLRDRAVPAADIITPNQFELDYLSGMPSADMAGLRAALASLHARGPKVILVTSYLGAETPKGSIDLIASAADGLWRVRTPWLNVNLGGAGDTIAALFLVHYLSTQSPAAALSRAASSVYGLLKRSLEAGAGELLTVAAQDEFVHPTHVFAAQAL